MSPKPPTRDVFKGLPRRIHVGPHTYRVVVSTELEDKDLVDCNGMSYHEDFKILLNENMSSQLAAEIVQHEVSHCVNMVYGVEDGATEEFMVTQHSKGITEVWLRNPRLHNWMVKTIRLIRKESTKD